MEDRQLLAADLTARFEFTDLAGTVVPSLQVGQDFLLRMYVRDVRSNPQGVFQAYFDVNYNASLVSANGPITHGPEYAAPGTTAGSTATAGLIDDVGGRDTDQFRPTPRDADLLLFSVPFRANQIGALPLTVDEADQPDRIVLFFDTVAGLPLNKIDFTGPGFNNVPPIEIVNPNATLLAVSATSAAKSEGNAGSTPFTFTVTRTGVTTGATTVNYAVAGTGTDPVNAADFGGTLPSGVVSFAGGETSQTITVNVSGDTTVEADEGFSVTLSNPSGTAQITTAAAVGTIQNDDTALTIAAAAAVKPEGNSGTTPFTFTVTRTGLATGTTNVSYTVAGTGADSANAADFGGTLPSGAVSFAAGETSKTVTVNVSGDTVVEPDEGFSVTLSNASGGAQILTATAAGTIQNDDTALTIAAAAAAKPEGNTGTTPFTFTVTRTGLLTGATTANYAVAGTGANPANAADFGGTLPSGAVSFAAGESTKTITVNASGDTAVEPDEGFSVTLSNASGGAQILTATAAGTIQNDDIALAIAVADAAKAEGTTGNTPFTFTVTRTGLTAGTTTVNYAVAGTGANPANTADFGGTLPSGVVSFAAGETSQTITVNVSGDTLAEPDEGFSVTLSNASGGAQILTGSAAGTIQNDDTALAIAAADAVKSEGNTGDTPFTFTVTRTGLTTATTTVTYTVAGTGANSANAADFGGTLPSGVVTFAAGETSQTITVHVSGDSAAEPDEGFSVTLSNASGGAQITTATAAGTIQNDDTALAIAAADAAKPEGISGSTPFTFTVTRTGLTTGTTTVNYTVAGTGTNPANAADFGGTLPSGVVSFAAGESTKTITVDVSGDTLVEPNENFSVTLSNASGGAQIVTATAAGTIQNDDIALAIAAADAAQAEGNAGSTSFTFTVTRAGLITGTTTVNYAVSGTGANPTNAADFGGTLPSGVVSFAAGETSLTITVHVSGDATVEPDEGFSITLSNASGGAQSIPATAAGTIRNDDTALMIAASDAVKAEGNGGGTPFTFTVTRTGLTTGTTTVNYAVAGTGTNPANAADFGGTLPSGQVSFAAGETSKTIIVNVVDDATVEPNEGFSVTLSNASGGAQITTATAFGTILDDDEGLTLAATDAVKGEGDAGNSAFTFTVSRAGQTTGTTTVSYTVAGTGANPSNAADFGGTLPSGVVSFAAGETSKTITINVSSDTTVEPDEGFSVTLSNPSGSVQITSTTANGTILNDDIALTIAVANAVKPEGNTGNTAFTFTVTRTGLTTGTTTANYAVTGIGPNPAHAADFGGTLPSGVVSFAAGETSKTITVNVSGDTAVELDEGFSVTLSNASGGAQIITATAGGTIQNDDTALAIAAADAAKPEGNAGITPFTFTVTRTGLTTGTTTVNYLVAGTEANPADFGGTLPGGVVSFAAGETAKTITVNVSGDTTVELDEAFSVTLSGASGEAQITAATAAATIVNDDTAVVSISGPSPADEGDAGSKLFEFTVTLSAPVDVPVSVDYATADGTAENQNGDHDYQSAQGTLAFQPGGSLTQTVTVAVQGDTVLEPDETFQVALSNLRAGTPARSVSLGNAAATATIVDDDAARLTISVTQHAAEDATHGLFTIVTDRLLSEPVQVLLAVTGTATAGADYVALGTTLTFPANTASVAVPVTVLPDELIEGDETVIVRITGTNAPAARPGTPDPAALTIADEDATTVSIAAGGGTPAEPAANGQFVVSLGLGKVAPPQGIVVTYSVGGSATASADYAALPSNITIPAGQSSAVISVAVLDDNVVEPTETVIVTLLGSNNPGATIDLLQPSATVSISDDDTASVSIDKIGDGAEGAPSSPGKFRVTQSKASSVATVVSYTVAGTATPGAGNDYVALSGTVTIAAGTTTADIDVAVLNDDLVETIETVMVTLGAITSGNAGVTVDSGHQTATVSIADDDTAGVSVVRLNDGAEAGVSVHGKFRVVQSKASSADTVLSYTVTGTATQGVGNDYSPLSATITIPAGATAAEIDVAVLDDDLVELTETVVVTLGAITTGHPGISLAEGQLSAIVEILDDDAAAVSIGKIGDGAESAVPVGGKFRVTQTKVSSTDTVLSYTVSGSAKPGAGDDYLPLAVTVTIPAGSTAADIDVTVLDDDLVEGPETVTVTLLAMTAGNPKITIDELHRASTLSIGDDDAATVSIDGVQNGAEAAPPVHGKFRVTQTKVSAADTVIRYTVAGMAVAGQDYTPLSGTVTVPAGTTTADIDVLVLDDDLIEGLETVIVTLAEVISGSPGVAVGLVNQTDSLDILDDDTATVSIDKVNDGAEGAVPADGRFRVTQTKASVTDTVLSYTVGGSATPGAGNDYLPPSGTLTIAAGQTSADIVLTVLNDSLIELSETVIVTLAGITGGAAGITIAPANNAATVSILDDLTPVSIVADDATGSEAGPDAGRFSVVLAAGRLAPSGGIQISYTVGGTATAGADYAALSGLVTIPAGQSSATISVNVLDDEIIELPETVVVTLTAADFANVVIDAAQAQATVTAENDDATTVSIAASDNSGSEPGTDSGQFTVTLDGGKVASAGGIVVSYTVGGTATNGADYVSLPGTVTIPGGQATATIVVDVLDDNIVELPETVFVTLAGTNHPAVTVNTAAGTDTVTISDGIGPESDATTVSIVATDATGGEPGADDGVFTVALAGGKLAPDGGITVTYAVTGTAAAGSDYTTMSGTVTIPGGQSSAILVVDVLDDNIVELPETVIATLTGTNHPGVTIAATGQTATATIEDDDSTTVSIAASVPSAAEPDGSGQLTVTLNNRKVAPPGGIVVSYTTAGTATAGSDYTPLSGSVTIPAGASSATIPVDVLNDNVVELAETVIVTLTGTDHAGATVGATGNTGTVTINDDDPTTVSILATDASGSEPGIDDGAFTVTLDGGKVAPAGGIAVTYTIGGTATAGTDYVALAGTATIPAGQSSVLISVDVLDDNVVEVPEAVLVTLIGTNHAGATIHATNKSATVTIVSADDDATVSISATDAMGREPGSDDALFTVTLSGGKIAPAGGITVNYTTGGTATAGADFSALAGTVTIPAGASSAAIAVDVLDDNVVESAETVLVTLTGTNHPGATVVPANSTATVTIEDDDPTTVSTSASDAHAGEPADNGQFTVTLDNGKVAPTGGIVVSYTIAGTATPGSDYTALAGSVTIPAGASSATIAVNVIADATADEPAETVVATLASVNHPSVTLSTASRSATVTIAEDDPKNASISGIVWIDANNDRQQQKDTAGNPLEPGIPGVIVRLTGTARDGSTLNLQAMTDDDGAYRFTNLPAGTYEVREEQPAAWIDGQEMLTSSTVNDTYSNIVLTPSQQAIDYSFGERTLQPQFISKRQFLASTPVTDVYLRELNALAKQRAGDTAGAQAVRDASILSVVSAQSAASAPFAQDASLDPTPEVESDEALLDAGESTPAAAETAPGGEGEVTTMPVPVAAQPIQESATKLAAAPAKTAPAAVSSSHVVQPAARAARVVRRSATSADALSLSPSVTDFPAQEVVTRQAAPVTRTFQPIGKSPLPVRMKDNRPTSTTRQVSDATTSRRLRETDQNLDTAQLVDLAFADDAWLATK